MSGTYPRMKLNELLNEEFRETTILRSMSLPEQIAAIKKKPSDFAYILDINSNPPDELKLAAVQGHGGWIEHIQNPTEEMIKAALIEPNFVGNEIKYDPYIKKLFKGNSIMCNKWLRYAKNVREME
jgi:hypothetical protein